MSIMLSEPGQAEGVWRKIRYGFLFGLLQAATQDTWPASFLPGYTEEERQFLHERRYKKKPYRRYLHDTCDWCGFVPVFLGQLDIHHKDGHHSNNSPLNLATLCSNCHRLAHYQIRSGIR